MRATLTYRLLCTAIVGCWIASEAWGQQPISWQPNVEIARRIAGQTNRLVLIHFWSPSCGPCLQMEQEVFPRREVAAAIDSAYVPVKLNADYFPATARQFGITALPTDVVITPQGQVVGKHVGALTFDKYSDMLNQVAATAMREAIPGYTQMPTASIPGPASQAAASLSAPPSYPANPNGAQIANPEAARGTVAATLPLYGMPGPSDTIPPGAGRVGSTSASEQPQGAFGAGTMAAPAGPGGPPSTAPGVYPGSANPGLAQSPTGWQGAASQPARDGQSRPAGTEIASAATASPVHPGNPPLGLDGYCPVQLAEKERWEKGNPRWGLIHRGRTYLFAGPNEQSRFFADPDRYAPVLSGSDVVLAAEQGQTVSGRREYGVWFEGRVYLFSNEDSLRRFDADPYRYARSAASQMAPTGAGTDSAMAAGPGQRNRR